MDSGLGEHNRQHHSDALMDHKKKSSIIFPKKGMKTTRKGMRTGDVGRKNIRTNSPILFNKDRAIFDMCSISSLQNDGVGLNIAGGNDWTNIIIPGDANSAEFHHEKTFLLADLVADAQYECLVQTKNQYGWSEASRIHRFLTHTNAFGT